MLIIVKEGKLGAWTEQGNQQLGGSVAYFYPEKTPDQQPCHCACHLLYIPLPRTESAQSTADVQSRLINWDTIRVQPTEKVSAGNYSTDQRPCWQNLKCIRLPCARGL